MDQFSLHELYNADSALRLAEPPEGEIFPEGLFEQRNMRAYDAVIRMRAEVRTLLSACAAADHPLAYLYLRAIEDTRKELARLADILRDPAGEDEERAARPDNRNDGYYRALMEAASLQIRHPLRLLGALAQLKQVQTEDASGLFGYKDHKSMLAADQEIIRHAADELDAIVTSYGVEMQHSPWFALTAPEFYDYDPQSVTLTVSTEAGEPVVYSCEDKETFRELCNGLNQVRVKVRSVGESSIETQYRFSFILHSGEKLSYVFTEDGHVVIEGDCYRAENMDVVRKQIKLSTYGDGRWKRIND